MGGLRPEFRAAVARAMDAPDDATPFLSESAEAVLGRGVHYNMAQLVYDTRERLTPHRAGGPDAVDIETVHLAACYHLARCRHLPEQDRTWDHHAAVFLFAVVHALRPGAVPRALRDAFAENPPQVQPAFEIVHAVGAALFFAGAPAEDATRVALATVLLTWAREEARGDASEPAVTFNLGSALTTLASLPGNGLDPGRTRAAGLHFMREAVTALPAGHPGRREMLHSLIRAQAEAPQDPPDEGSMLADLTQYTRDGDLARLDALIGRLRSAVDAATAGDSERAHHRVSLGQVLRMRFETAGELADLDSSITELTEVLAEPLGDAARATALSFLGLAHLDRYVTSKDPADLEAATTAARRACAVDHPASPAHPQHLTNLAAVLTARYDAHGDVTELDEAVHHLEYAAAATPPSQHDRPVMLIKWAVALRQRGTRTGNDADLDAAEKLLRQVAGKPSDTGPNQQLARMELGHLLHTRDRRTRGARLDQVEAARQYRATALAATQDVRTRLHCAALWGFISATLGATEQARTAFGVALTDLLPKLTAPALGRQSQETRLREVPSLANVAAAVEIGAGRPREALVRLEQGRGVLLAQALRLRRRHDDLAAASQELADRYERVRTELLARQRGPEQRREAAAEFDRVVAEIRGLPGFDGFHRPPDWARLRAAAEHGPVAVINVSPLRCDALLLRRRSGGVVVEVLPLPGVTAEETGRRADAFHTAVTELTRPGGTGGERYAHDRELKRTLRWLGERIVGPVLTRLGLDRPVAPGGPVPRLWWCPTGVLSLLPLHAAVLDGGSRTAPVYAHDRVVSSYVPTLGSLLHARDTPAPGAGRTSLAAVGVDAGDTYPRLTALTDELAATAGLPGPRTELRDARATPDAVLAALRAHTHAHLACHGVRDATDPSRGRLLLHGGDLTLRELAAEQPRDAEFAYLSACHSAAPGEELADEVISLASAFQLCGYRHVIGSLWTVEDAMGPPLAREVYRLLGAPDTPGPAHALHRALGALREHPRYAEPLFWASVVHSGP
ncbi:CHAT domain-containing protein [Streptomyces sp. HMX112]|uniref:CHAT domain-containing protein n=1 Tax=Streptomyces sp. HMX112 TaxID=3390850 RepID=UPI003A800D88